jgi:hypothetical protein
MSEETRVLLGISYNKGTREIGREVSQEKDCMTGVKVYVYR